LLELLTFLFKGGDMNYSFSYYYSRIAKDGIKQKIVNNYKVIVLFVSLFTLEVMAVIAIILFRNGKFNFVNIFCSFCLVLLAIISVKILSIRYYVKEQRTLPARAIAIAISKSGEVKILTKKELNLWTDNLWINIDTDKDQEVVCWPATHRFYLKSFLEDYFTFFEINLLLSLPCDEAGVKKIVEMMKKEGRLYIWEGFITAKIVERLLERFSEFCQITDCSSIKNSPDDFVKRNKAAEEIIKPILDEYGIKIVN
jgi:hypothetical protein